MPALDAHRIFLSTVTAEFARYRTELATRFERVSVKAVFQEEFEYHDADLIEKLYQLILPCDVVIHFVGAAAGAVANPKAVEDFLQRCKQRGEDFLGFWTREYGLERGFFDQLTYTQWEAVIAVFLNKKFMPLQPQGQATDGHPPGKPAFTPTAEDTISQTRHLGWLSKTIRRYPQPLGEKEGSYLEDAFHKITGFLLRENAQWRQTAQQLQALPKPTRKIAPSRILRHAPQRLFGREGEMAALDAAWAAKDRVNIYTLVAWGGTGKTSLVAHWVQEHFVKKRWQEVERYFDWSFYSQGTGESRQTSSDLFMSEALTFFGDPDPTLGSSWDRGQRLAHLMRQHRTLLVLDGIEPLQYPPTDRSGQGGMLKDQGLESLFQGLAMDFPFGLCLVTTRETVANLKSYHDSTAPETTLDTLSKDSATALLRYLGLVGSDEEMEAAWRDAGGHALTLQLLGRFIADAFPDRDIRHYREVRFEEADLERQGRSAFKVMRAYESWLQNGEPERQRELDILRLTGLFDRPISHDCLSALRTAPVIPGLTERLVPLTEREWHITLRRPQSIDLISLTHSADPSSFSLDAHPLIREYFAKQLRERQPEAFRAAHSRLFEHLCQSTEHRPDTLEGLQPLYQAMVHGCLAGRLQEVCDNVYHQRILRGNDGYSIHKLGAISEDLSALMTFFQKESWHLHSPGLHKEAVGWILNEVAIRLHFMGFIDKAIWPFEITIEIALELQDWEGVAAGKCNLSSLEVTRGHLDKALATARSAIDFANQSTDPDPFYRICSLSIAADAQHQRGNRKDSRDLFDKAETLQSTRDSNWPKLYSLPGYRFCDLILAPAERAAWVSTWSRNELKGESVREAVASLTKAQRRAEQTLDWVMNLNLDTFSLALDNLILARIVLYRALLHRNPTLVGHNPSLAKALEGLRNSRRMEHIPLALLTVALQHHFLGEVTAAHCFLNEAEQVAHRGPMPLYLADVHLHRARLFHDKAELAKARALIEKYSYGRRWEELADAEEAAKDW